MGNPESAQALLMFPRSYERANDRMQVRYSTQTCAVHVYRSKRKTGEMRITSFVNDIFYQVRARIFFINKPGLSMIFGIAFKERKHMGVGRLLTNPANASSPKPRRSHQNKGKTQHDRNLQGLSLLAPSFLHYYNALLTSRMYFFCRKQAMTFPCCE